MKITAKRPLRDEKGQTMILVLVLLLIGIIIITPVLKFMGTGMTSGRVYEQKIDEIYAADAGVEDALWHIRYDQVEDLLGGGYDEYNYNPPPYDYPYDLSVNGKNVTVTIQNIWIPKDIDIPSSGEASQIIKDEKLLIIGFPSSTESTYEIKIVYYWEDWYKRDALRVEKIGIWLSPGFEYEEDSCSLTGYSEDISPYKGGSAVVWTFASEPRLRDFPGGDLGPPMVETLTFEYTGPEGELPELVSSWIITAEDIPDTDYNYTWDDSIRLYKIVSEAGGIQVEAYGAKTKFRRLKSTIASDYGIAGNTWMKATGGEEILDGCSYPEKYFRDRLYAESAGTVQRIGMQAIPESGVVPPGEIPEEAVIEDVYLYWTGWIDYHYFYYWPGGGWPYTPPGWYWGEIAALKYPSTPTMANLTTLVEESAQVNKVKFDIDDAYSQTVTADKWQTARTDPSPYGWPQDIRSWAYSCFADVTDLPAPGGMTVREYIEEAMTSNSTIGEVTFTVGHDDAVIGEDRDGYPSYDFTLYINGDEDDPSTGYPLATPAHKIKDEDEEIVEICYRHRYNYTYAGWSLIIFYRSPALKQRYLRLFDDFIMCTTEPGYPYHEEKFTISGFLAPPVLSEGDTSHLTYFVGEGDAHFEDSQIGINIGQTYGEWLNDPPPDYYPNPEDNVFNSLSSGIAITESDGIDVDTFELPQGCIRAYDASAEVTLHTTWEIYFLVYLVLSFRSDLTTGGIITNYSVSPSG